jgi:hypothetical protein
MRLCEPRFAMWLALVKVWLTAITVTAYPLVAVFDWDAWREAVS